jgi:hypothetical protein
MPRPYLTSSCFDLIIVCMADQILLYISAAEDLRPEREILSRAVTEVPVSLGWRIVHSPVELSRLQGRRAELESSPGEAGEVSRGGAGESDVLLSRERYVPSDGVLIQDRDGEDA